MGIHTKIQLLADDLAKQLKDKKNFGWYLHLAKKYDEHFLRVLLSEVKEATRKRKIRNMGAYFITLLQQRKNNAVQK